MAIFIMDNNAEDKALLREILKDTFSLHEMNDIRSVFAKIDVDLIPKAIIVDMGHPEAVILMQELQNDSRTRIIPVIAIIENDNSEDRLTALKECAVVTLMRPLDAEFMLRIITITVERHSKNLIKESIDEKTGILKKEYFCRNVREILTEKQDKKHVIIRWDIDRFKVLNDTFGTGMGDSILLHIGETLKKAADVFEAYGHWTADNFVLLMEADKFNPDYLLYSLTKALSRYLKSFKFTLRIGVYEIDDPMLDVNLMCDRAFLALRSTKDKADNYCAYYTATMRDALIEEQELSAEMNSALEQGQFHVYLQPQYDYAQNKMCSAEALVRWIHPEKGVIPPIRFIPLFEKNGFITRLDEYVWEQSCKFLRNLLNRGIPIVPIGINVSRRDVDIDWLVHVLDSLMENYKLDPSYIHVEITESAYMENPDMLIKLVNTLHEHGFQVQMDDFGSGYSSLNMLKDVFVDTIKMDMKFIANNSNIERSGIILSYLIRMAHWLKMTVIAEGVETKEQADYLRNIGCLYMQGYYFARPMPTSDFEKLLISNNGLSQIKKHNMFGDEEASKFFNMSDNSMLLFNRLAGAAALIERLSDHIEVLRMNDAFFSELETTRDEFTKYQQHILDAISEKDRSKVIDCLNATTKNGAAAFCTVRFKINPHKQEIKVRLRLTILAANDDSSMFYCMIDNISSILLDTNISALSKTTKTKKSAYEKWVEKRNEKHSTLKDFMTFDYDINRDTMFAISTDENMKTSERKYEHYSTSVDPFSAVESEYHDALVNLFKFASENVINETLDVRASIVRGKMHWYKVMLQSVADENGKIAHVFGSFEAVSNVKNLTGSQISANLEKDASISMITSACSSRPVKRTDALLLIAIDNYKKITDRSGVREAMRITQEVGEQLEPLFRAGDIAAHFENGEFIVYARSVGNIEFALRLAASIVEKTATVKSDAGLPVSCSVGIVKVDGKKETFDELLEKSDAAMEYVINHGGNSFALYSEEVMPIDK